ncbi:MAG: glycosyltransferase family 2 protein [Cellvibrionaceae bacterium]
MYFLFWFSALLIVYTYALYPVFIYLLATFFPKETIKIDAVDDVTVVVIVYNEVARIEKKIKDILSSNYPKEKLQILVVSDGSDDATKTVVESLELSNVTFLENSERRGKAACLNDAFSNTQTELVVLTDVRQTFEPDAIKNMLACLSDPDVGAVSGELHFSSTEHTGEENKFSQSVDAYWQYETFIRAKESEFFSAIGVTGAIYAIRKSLFQAIPDNTVLDDVLIPMNVVMQGKRVLFESSAIAYDIPSSDSAREETRKIRTLAGNYQLVALRPDLIKPWCNPAIIQYISHKLLRLVMPVFLAVLLLSSFLLMAEHWFYVLAFLGQTFFYLLPIIENKINHPLFKKIVSIRNAFVSMNMYAYKAMIEFFTNKNLHLWKK